MKYFTLLSLFIFNVNLLSSDTTRISTSSQPYLFTYILNNPSLGSIDGTERAKILMQSGTILSVWNLKAGLKDRNILGLKTLIDAINGSSTQALQAGVTVKNEKIVKTRDIRSYQPIVPLTNHSFFTIRELFDIINKRLENDQQISVLYIILKHTDIPIGLPSKIMTGVYAQYSLETLKRISNEND